MSSQKEEESTSSQSCNPFELQEEVKKLKEQLRDSEAEIQQLKVALGRCLFLEDKEKRIRKLQILPGVPRSDESRQYTANSSCIETGLDGRLLDEGASLRRLRGVAAVSPACLPLKGERLDVLSGKDDRRKIVTRRSRVSARSSALSDELDGGRISESREDTSPASFSSFESSAENERTISALRDTEDYKGLPLESLRNDGTEQHHIPISSDQAGPSSIFSSTRSNASDSLVLNSAEGEQVTFVRDGSSDSCEEMEPTKVFLATGSGFSGGISSGKTSLNTGSFEEEIPQQAQFSDTKDNVTDVGGNNETIVDDMLETSMASCNGETRSSWSGPRASPTTAEPDSGISSSGNAVAAAYHSLLNGHEGLIVGDDDQLTLQDDSVEDDQRTVAGGECIPDCSSETGSQLLLPRNSNKHDQRPEGTLEPGCDSSSTTGNELLLQRNSNEHDQRKGERLEPGCDCSSKAENQPPPQQNSSESDQVTEGSREPDAANSSSRNWERLGARPKRTQTQRPVDPPLWPSSSPVSDSLAKDFLARHSQDRAVQERLYTDDRDLSYLGPERLRNTSLVDGLTSASDAYSVRPYFGTMGASPYERLGGAFSDVPSSGPVVSVGLLGGSSTEATVTPLSSFTEQTDFSSACNGMSSDRVNASNRFLLPNDFANSDHSLTGERDFNKEYDSLLDQSLLLRQQSLQQLSNPISPLPNSRFVYGSTGSDFDTGAWYGAAAIHPGYSLYDTQGHVLSNGNSTLIDDQMSRSSNLNLESQSSQFGDREQVPGSFAASGGVAGSRDFPLSYTVSPSSFSSTMAVSNLTCRPSVAAASNLTSSVVNTTRNSVFSSIVAGDGNEDANHLPASGEVNSKDTTSSIDYGRSTVEPNDNSLVASEQRMAEDASVLVERMLREREEREEFMRELQRKKQMIREERERERREKEDREWQEAERWPPQQEGVSTGSRWLCEHYQRRCRVRFPCCTQFYPCHRCHNSSSNCKNDEAKACHATHLKCSLCQLEQEIDETSDVCKGCGEKMAAYFCSLCKHFTSDPQGQIVPL
ncbi:putative E3 ubiquitin-protein ligase RZFP34 [Acropora cervicornis]|uniref:E3 ubiquitin-protein ligase RZFP34 n=1 Tax=Acropora cervicornis TaxID=6130 RepID=A0AAD9QSE1_ACRCE|nr:putative E3 ubiquitin-protein ligase RZFP34 [Acropora cervicornis]